MKQKSISISDWDYLFTDGRFTDKNFVVRFFEFSNKNYTSFSECFDAFCEVLEQNEAIAKKLILELKSIFGEVVFRKYLADSGIALKGGVSRIILKKINETILPQIENDKTLTSVLNNIFYNAKNKNSIKKISKEQWKRFYAILLQTEPQLLNTKAIQSQIMQSVLILIDRINGGFYDSEMIRYYEDFDYFQSPFSKLSATIHRIVDKPDEAYDILRIKEYINSCKIHLNNILTQKDLKGISLDITQKVYRIRKQLERLQILLQNYYDLKKSSQETFLVNITKNWIEFYNPKNYFRKKINNTLNLIAFLVTHHNGQTGESYITTSKKDWIKMFFSASGGGFIVAFLCFIKLFISQLDSSPFVEALGYSINYALGFVIIYLLHFTLATKQPAMTAANIAKSLANNDKSRGKIETLAFTRLFSRLSRSQFIAFIGNIGLSFPISVLIYLVLNNYFGVEIISENKAVEWYNEITTPYISSFWYASIAGVFLFISGLSSGLFINGHRFHNISDRIQNHPVLIRYLSAKNRQIIVTWIDKNGGGIIGNILLGIFLGCAFLVGKFIGIPFDIRHITFQGGNYAIALSKLGFSYGGIFKFLIGFIAIFGIGFMNFIVSFSLSLFVALRSNNLPIKTIIPVIKSVINDFRKHPVKYFLPVEK